MSAASAAQLSHAVLRSQESAKPAAMGQFLDAPARAPELSVVIVSWNSGQDLLNCLCSLRDHPPTTTWETLVVDNGSSDGSLDEVRDRFPWARVIANASDRGLAAANNQGIAASRAPYVLISNPDVVYQPGTVDALLALLERRPRAAFAVARLVDSDGRLQTSAGDLPRIADALLGRRLSRRLRGRSGSQVWWHHWPHDEERSIGHGAEACYLVRREALAAIGLQDERFRLDWEGIDWSARAWRAGWEVWFCPEATAVHLGGTSVKQVPLRWIASTHRGMYLYLRRQVRPLLRPLLAFAVFARAVAKVVMIGLSAQVYDRAHRGRA
jgi:GT2 family glycosyltransferase